MPSTRRGATTTQTVAPQTHQTGAAHRQGSNNPSYIQQNAAGAIREPRMAPQLLQQLTELNQPIEMTNVLQRPPATTIANTSHSVTNSSSSFPQRPARRNAPSLAIAVRPPLEIITNPNLSAQEENRDLDSLTSTANTPIVPIPVPPVVVTLAPNAGFKYGAYVKDRLFPQQEFLLKRNDLAFSNNPKSVCRYMAQELHVHDEDIETWWEIQKQEIHKALNPTICRAHNCFNA